METKLYAERVDQQQKTSGSPAPATATASAVSVFRERSLTI